MKIKIIKSAPWQVGVNLTEFTEGQTLEVGVDVPDKIAEDMLRCEYAIKATAGRPRIETKKETTISRGSELDKSFDIETANADELETFARKELGLELDKRVNVNKLRKQVRVAIKEKNNE